MKFNQIKFRYVVILNNQDDFTTTPTHASIEITAALLWRIIWYFMTWRIASWMNTKLFHYQVEFFDVPIDWLDAKCGCVGDCNCGKGTPQGMLSPQEVEQWYEESSDADYVSGTLLSIEGWGMMQLSAAREYNPSPFHSETTYFRDWLAPFLP